MTAAALARPRRHDRRPGSCCAFLLSRCLLLAVAGSQPGRGRGLWVPVHGLAGSSRAGPLTPAHGCGGHRGAGRQRRRGWGVGRGLAGCPAHPLDSDSVKPPGSP
ncbi:hypothetical protein BDA96_04G007900 [Sorghum bicolor]|uniref:Secreted protein n=2 Tax=Sorghum bicolor TaxID=4558 RepID=A0A921R102_SORBI|nr:hypothetical protein BDA96_04G007900 [Sorghum bicolor]KXG29278.1 hypothetical protein SORBI_3004G007200 [Sorghum bicolor]